MAKTVTVRNNTNGPVLVGDRYLLPGEQRQVLASHLVNAVGKDRLLVLSVSPAERDTEAPLADPPDSETESGIEAVVPEKPARNRRSGK